MLIIATFTHKVFSSIQHITNDSFTNTTPMQMYSKTGSTMHVVRIMNTQVHLACDPHHKTKAHLIFTITIGNASPAPTWDRLLALDPHHRTREHQNQLPSQITLHQLLSRTSYSIPIPTKEPEHTKIEPKFVQHVCMTKKHALTHMHIWPLF